MKVEQNTGRVVMHYRQPPMLKEYSDGLDCKFILKKIRFKAVYMCAHACTHNSFFQIQNVIYYTHNKHWNTFVATNLVVHIIHTHSSTAIVELFRSCFPKGVAPTIQDILLLIVTAIELVDRLSFKFTINN